MKLKPFSIAGLMAVIVFFAVGFAALREPTGICASAVYSMALGSIGVAILGTVFGHGPSRAFWAGYVVLSSGYTFLVHETSTDNAAYLARYFVSPRRSAPGPELMTTHLLVAAYERLLPAPDLRQGGRIRVQWGGAGMYFDASVLEGSGSQYKIHYAGDTANTWDEWVGLSRIASPGLSDDSVDSFVRTGHSVVTPLVGLAGSLVAMAFYRRREQARRSPAGPGAIGLSPETASESIGE
jgi:hypothetical protein